MKALNRRLLASQCLSGKASGSHAVVKVAEACCGVNSQDFLESVSSFWARVDGFKDSDLMSELRPNGGLVRTWTVRSTMHIIPAKDYFVHVLGGPGRRFPRLFDRLAKERGIPDRDFRVRFLYEPLLDHIKGRAVTTNELREFMVGALTKHGLKAKTRLQRGWSSQATYGPSWSGLSEMSHLGLLVSAGRRGSETLWMSSADWLCGKLRPPDQDECGVGLVRRYIDRYGPVSREDVAYWTFLKKSDVDMALEALKGELVRESLGAADGYFSTGKGPDPNEPPGVIILPEFDSLMMGHRDKSRFLSHDGVKSIFWGLGGINRTVLLDGFVAATWRRKKTREGMTVSVRPLRALTGRERRSVEEGFAGYADYKGTEASVAFEGRV